MPHSHHSHSGEFCMHARDTLEEVVLTAIEKGMKVLALTEHMPRDLPDDLYPEETEARITNFDLWRTFADFCDQANKMRATYGHLINILVGFEVDYIRESSIQLVQRLQEDYKFDMFLGAVHHVNTIPIDFDRDMYLTAQASCGGSDEKLFEAYFDAQYAMLQLQPPIVAHFDLIRLFSENPTFPLQFWPGVWGRVVRNIEFVVGYGGLFELNSASLRKGWDEPYPRRDVCEAIVERGGRFCLSDDSHGASQVGLNYDKLLFYVESLGIENIHYLERLPMGQIMVDCLGPCKVRSTPVQNLRNEPFYLQYIQ
ncbi:histidinol phosphate phosphatase H [Terfezia boudieri ATCC MYA-4762]|uniref:Histidinol-phosphatase n=1 Tax=Terfezia boudieri ATCC MYA-4762 TaxID=1051890 RepID=A0A3N4LSZ7_9PEZI|nr:histidinol phosphate phosphatase H [Terfezia boudieri ATCC MYA-4762]